jgi:hypothetical protein
MADAYKLKADASFPRVVRSGQTIQGEQVDETEGVNFPAGSYILASEMTSRDAERAENGDLDHLLEDASVEEVDQYRTTQSYGVFIPEHEAEAVILQEYGHEVVPRDQLIELKSQGADAAAEAVEAQKEEVGDDRPNLTAKEVSSITDTSESPVVPKDSEHVSEESLEGVEQPPGLLVGNELESAQGGDPSKPKAAARKRPSTAKSADAQKAQENKQEEKSE